MGIANWGVEQMAELGGRHAALEAKGELEPLLETLAPDPIYSFHPLDLAMRGDEQVRRYYVHFVENFLPLRAEVELIGQWVNETSVVQEYVLDLDIDRGPERHHVVGILFVDDESAALGKLRGERVYSSERFARLLTGEVFDSLTPL